MVEENEEVGAMTCCSEDSGADDMIKHCPMAARFDQIIGKSRLGLYLMVLGVALIVLGITIVVQPKILVWLAGAVATLMGVALVVAAYQINRMKSSLGNR